MVISMFLAHLVGDYILQWDSLASWKARELKGVLAHGLIVTIVTWLFILPFDPSWIEGVAFICIAHILVDAVQLYIKLPVPPLARFGLDQLAHFIIITAALLWGGYLDATNIMGSISSALHNDRLWLLLLIYAFVSMPAWVIVKFAAYGLVKGSPPNFGGTNKYIGIMERILITTFVAMGQFILVPLVAVPRVVMEWPTVTEQDDTAVYVAELLASICVAVAMGIMLAQL